MDTIKLILIVIGMLTVAFLGYMLIGVIFSLLWYAVIIGIIGAAGYAGYKFLTKDDKAQIEGKEPVAIREMDNADRTLEEYKRKYLPK